MEKIKGVQWGVDYYPEQDDASFYEADAKRMKSMGFKYVRMMEFAWSILEPREGVYDFSLFDKVIDILAKEGIKTVLGTPTATFPIWLLEKDKAMLQVYPNGVQRSFGTRREGCFNSKVYFEASKKIALVCAKHYGDNPNVVGWQIDNEVGHEGSDRCICENCRNEWAKWLENKYKTIDELNRVYGTVFWGTTYTSFEQVPVAKYEVSTSQNPTLILDYYRFSSDSAVKYVDAQIDILREKVNCNQWITTNLYPTPLNPVIDMDDLTKNMDFASYDNYPIWGEQNEAVPYYFLAYALSFTRGLNNRGNYAIMEQISGIQGHTCMGALPPEKQITLWTNQAVARGADKMFYFRWKTAAFAQEQLCYGLFDADNLDTHRSIAIEENMKEHKEDFELFASVAFEAEACLLYDKDNQRLLRDQILSKGLYNKQAEFAQVGYDAEMAKSFAPFVLFNVNADILSVKNVDLSKYKLISLPLYQMTDEAFVKELETWVENGGHLVIGYRAGSKDLNNHSVKEALPGKFSKLAGVKVRRFEALNETKVKIKMGIIPIKGEVFADIIDLDTAVPLAYYSDQKKHYKGHPAITVNSFGKGKVYYVGTSLDPKGIFFFYRKVLKAANLNPKFLGQGIEMIKRRTTNGDYVDIVLNHTSKTKRVKGKQIKPYEMIVFKNSNQ